jgi:chromosome segregation ATPase
MSVKAAEKSVKAAEKQIEFQDYTFSKNQIIDLIKNTLNPIIFEIINEIKLGKDNKISYQNKWSLFCKNSQEIECLDFYSIEQFSDEKYEIQKYNLSVIGRDEFIIEIPEILEKRQIQLCKCKNSISNLISFINKFENKLYLIINKLPNIEEYPYSDPLDPEDNILGFSEYVVFYEENDLIPLDMWKDLIISLMVYDVINSVNSIANRFPWYLIDSYDSIKTEFFKNLPDYEITRLKLAITTEVDKLLKIDSELLSQLEKTKKEYRKNFRITSSEIGNEWLNRELSCLQNNKKN